MCGGISLGTITMVFWNLQGTNSVQQSAEWMLVLSSAVNQTFISAFGYIAGQWPVTKCRTADSTVPMYHYTDCCTITQPWSGNCRQKMEFLKFQSIPEIQTPETNMNLLTTHVLSRL